MTYMNQSCKIPISYIALIQVHTPQTTIKAAGF